MEGVKWVIFLGIVIVVLIYYSWRVVNWVYLRPKRVEKLLRKQGFKGNPYTFLYGDFKEMAKTMEEALSKPIKLGDDIKPRVLHYVFKTVQKYGNESFIWEGPKPSVVITDAELVKEVLAKFPVFQKHVNSNPLVKKLGGGLATLEKEKWAKQRKIINPAFHLDKLKLMVPAFHTVCEEVVKQWEESLSAEGWCEMDVWPYLETITSDAISRTAFGSSYQQGRRIFELQREQADHVMNVLQSMYIPGSRFLPTKRNKRIKEINREIKSIVLPLIDERINAMEAGAACSEDLLGILLETNLKEIEQSGSKRNGMSMDEVVNEFKLFYFAGQETTSTLLTWTLILLSKFPEWQTRAREEVVRVFGTLKPDFDGLNRLKIVTMILYEVLRLYPSIISVNREVSEDAKLGKFVFPVGTLISLPIILFHHDRDVWGDDALDFNPKRFSEGVLKAQKKQGLFFPFGWGPRICIGQNFAMTEAKVAVAMMLQRFSFELSPSYTHAPISTFLIRPQHGAHMTVHKL